MERPLLVVAGAGQGSGRALTLLAIRRGYDVVAISRSPEHLASLAEELGSEARHLVTHTLDLGDEEACRQLVAVLGQNSRSIRGLVNCAATWTGGVGVIEATAETFRRSFDLNFFTALNMILPVLAHWEQHGRAGELAIVNLGATASLRGGKRSAPFATAKGALRTLSQSLAKELGPAGVHVAHLVIDGLIDNPRTRALNPQTAQDRFVDPSAIAATVLQLVEQPRSCWTFELDLRPHTESW